MSTTGPSLFYTRREPYGVVGLISPCTSPLLMSAMQFGPALAAGNVVVHKPSEVTPLTMLRLSESIKEAGFPPGVFNILVGLGSTAGTTLTSSHRVRMVSFRGTTTVGRKVLESSSMSNLKKVTLSLSGKSPIIVCPDADLDRATQLIWSSIMTGRGLCCTSGSRLFIHEKIYDEVLMRLKEMTKTISTTTTKDIFEGGVYGPLTSLKHMETVLGFIKHGLEVEKLTLLTGGKRLGSKGFFVEPTIFTHMSDDSKLA